MLFRIQKNHFAFFSIAVILAVGAGIFWYADEAFGVIRTWDGGGGDETPILTSVHINATFIVITLPIDVNI